MKSGKELVYEKTHNHDGKKLGSQADENPHSLNKKRPIDKARRTMGRGLDIGEYFHCEEGEQNHESREEEVRPVMRRIPMSIS